MDWTRRALGSIFTLLGAYYCLLGVLTLVRVPDVTRRWIEQSGDPDFKYDYGLFMMLSGLGATLIAVLGWRTVVKGMTTARGLRASWLGLAIAAIPLHWFWFLYRIIGAGILDRHGQTMVQRTAAIQFGTACIGYIVLGVIGRRSNRSGPA